MENFEEKLYFSILYPGDMEEIYGISRKALI